MGTEFSTFIPALQLICSEVQHFESWDKNHYPSPSVLNQALLNTVEQFRPHVMLTVQMGYELWTETLDIIRARGDVATISWAADDSWKFWEVSRFIGHHYDAMSTTYDYIVPQYQKLGIPVVLSQWAVPRAWLREPLPANSCRYPVSFVGMAHGNRPQLVERLRKRGVNINCFGHGWPNGPLSIEEMREVMRSSVISLNFSNSKGVDQIKARTFEVPGVGGFLLTSRAPGLEQFYIPDKEVAVFNNEDEMVRLIDYYLTNTKLRDAIAVAGHIRTAADHTYEQRMEKLLAFVLDTKLHKKLELLPAPSFDNVLVRNRMTPGLLFLRNLLLNGGKLFFGTQRGPRAARRLVFELAWRLCRERAFSAAGWPGRLFPNL